MGGWAPVQTFRSVTRHCAQSQGPITIYQCSIFRTQGSLAPHTCTRASVVTVLFYSRERSPLSSSKVDYACARENLSCSLSSPLENKQTQTRHSGAVPRAAPAPHAHCQYHRRLGRATNHYPPTARQSPRPHRCPSQTPHSSRQAPIPCQGAAPAAASEGRRPGAGRGGRGGR